MGKCGGCAFCPWRRTQLWEGMDPVYILGLMISIPLTTITKTGFTGQVWPDGQSYHTCHVSLQQLAWGHPWQCRAHTLPPSAWCPMQAWMESWPALELPMQVYTACLHRWVLQLLQPLRQWLPMGAPQWYVICLGMPQGMGSSKGAGPKAWGWGSRLLGMQTAMMGIQLHPWYLGLECMPWLPWEGYSQPYACEQTVKMIPAVQAMYLPSSCQPWLVCWLSKLGRMPFVSLCLWI